MKTLLATLSLTGSVRFAGLGAAQERQNLIRVVTSPEPQTQLMAMVLTFQAARQGWMRAVAGTNRP